MRESDGVFSQAERKAALWAVAVALAVTAAGLVFDALWSRPSLGAFEAAASAVGEPGIIDAAAAGPRLRAASL